MSKKLIAIIVVALILIVAILAALFILKPANQLENPDDTQSEIGISKETPKESLAGHMGITVEEFEEQGKQELTQEDSEIIQSVIEENRIPEIVEILDDGNPDDNSYDFIDSEGNQGTMTVNNPNLTDGEIDEWTEKYLEMLEKMENGEDVDTSWLEESIYGDTSSSGTTGEGSTNQEDTSDTNWSDETIIGNPSDPGDEGVTPETQGGGNPEIMENDGETYTGLGENGSMGYEPTTDELQSTSSGDSGWSNWVNPMEGLTEEEKQAEIQRLYEESKAAGITIGSG